ncbi:hypothetical protein A3K86_03700 [Photobacterium jeanii]|uniref:Protein nucleotidyltransferase YdiU n=1 Tax=Photobacterium jeanii TaxID=858640 RepID=A0A178KMP8_9GAMM|nr:YdiU family protein [Photobacterium jeanii]OAN18034.1 hypothetical protein A3K86_03700 [Photobacterium jeanii]PST92296.1 YdiU family protein [Photobacterium jeanii]
MARSLEQLTVNNTFAQLPTSLYTRVNPQPLSDPFLVSVNPQVSDMLELDVQVAASQDFIELFTGNRTLPQFEPLAMKYTGHQFGQYNPDLGDGRGLLMGEVTTSTGNKWDIHLKGSGLTPYSRQGDGRAVLRSSIREYLASAAMHGLGIATTHALAILTSTTPVYREQIERGATLVRVAESHVRFGHFEYLFYSQQHQELKQLADYVIQHHFPELLTTISDDESRYEAWFEQVVARTATMIADWQSVGFAHGVMNTDNMSILGLTFDYGPYGFLDDYNRHFICNHSDYSGRYAFNQQPSIALWNLAALGYALSPIIQDEKLNTILDSYEPRLQVEFSQRMRAKLGLTTKQDNDAELFQSLFQLLQALALDYTRFFRTLSHLTHARIAISQDEILKASSAQTTLCSNNHELLSQWLQSYQDRVEAELIQTSDAQRLKAMQATNPKFILRNYLAQQAIAAAEQGDFEKIEQLMTVLSTPFDEHPEFEKLADLPPDWGKTLEISCSS